VNCPKCSEGFSVVTEVRHGATVGRDRMCPVKGCGFTWQTVEKVTPLLVVEDEAALLSRSEQAELPTDQLVAYHRDRILEISEWS